METKLTPSEYFEHLKNAKQNITTEALKDSYEVFIGLAKKYKTLGQVESLKKLCFLADVITKEEKLIELGITTYIYKDVIEDYIENVADKTVKIIELKRYMREVPDELVSVVEKTKDFFDEFFIVFTDYTGQEERKVKKERRDKDPILFGVFKNSRNISDRFYFLGDWVDEYCDLTLDKMIDQYKTKKGYSPVLNEEIPKTSKELVDLLKSYKIDDTKKTSIDIINNLNGQGTNVEINSFKQTNEKQKKGFFEKIKSVFTKKYNYV